MNLLFIDANYGVLPKFAGHELPMQVKFEVPVTSAREHGEPFTHGVGPAGAYLAGLDAERRTALREACRRRVPSEPFVITAVAWAARGLA